MFSKYKSVIARSLFLAAGCLSAMAAHADWQFSTTGNPTANSFTYNGNPTTDGTVSLTGLKAANAGTCTGGTGVGTNGYTCTVSGFGTGATWTTNALTSYGTGGMGMTSDGSTTPNHAIDNGPATTGADGACGLSPNGDCQTGVGNTEAVLLSFSKSVILTSIGFGYVLGDADISLFRYIGTDTNPLANKLTGIGTSLATMQANGWELVGNYANLTADSTDPYNLVNPGGNKGSSWWLVSAYNTAYGSGTNLDQGNDYFKLFAAAGTKCYDFQSGGCGPGTGGGVPEPGSLALAGLAIVGGGFSMRRRRRAEAVAA